MVRMITTGEHQYRGHRLRVGEEYDCEPQHVELMLKHGWARPAEREGKDGLAYQTRMMTAETPKKRGRPRKVKQ